MRLLGTVDRSRTASVEAKRRLLAHLCRILGSLVNADTFPTPHSDVGRNGNGNGHPTRSCPDLSPRLRQTLDRLLAGDSEKQIAGRLKLSPNTVHVYVKALYRRFDVCSRGELLSRFVRQER
jgi:DNA-binding CsgD family transcriptional regulator